MNDAKNGFERLLEAGVIGSGPETEAYREVFAELTEAETELIIRLDQRMLSLLPEVESHSTPATGAGLF
jgi:hypothetical protein